MDNEARPTGNKSSRTTVQPRVVPYRTRHERGNFDVRKQALWFTTGILATSLTACAGLSPSQLQTLALDASQTSIGKTLISNLSADIQSANDLSTGQSLLTNMSPATVTASSLTSSSPLAVQALTADGSASFEMRGALQAFEAHRRFQQFAAFRLKMMQARAKLLARREAFRKRAQARLDRWQQGEAKIATASLTTTATASDGSTSSVEIDTATISISVPNRYSQTQVHSQTYAIQTDGSKDLVEEQSTLDRTFGRATYQAYRDRVDNSDGSYTVTYSATTSVNPASGSAKVRTVNWTENGNSDGSATFTGTLVRFDGTTVDLSMTKDTSGTETTKAVDSSANVEADITQSDSSTAASGVVGEPGKTGLKGTVTANVSDTESVDLGNGQ